MNKELLKLKQLTPLNKIIIQLILDTPDVVIQIQKGYSATSNEIAINLGTTSKIIKNAIWELEELGLIVSHVNGDYRERITNITKHMKDLLKPAKDDSEDAPVKQLLTS